MTTEQHLDTLHPVFRAYVAQLLATCEARGCPFRLTQSLRSMEAQEALYMQGRHPLPLVNGVRASIGLLPIKEADNRVVTGAPPGYSLHNFGLAADVCYATGKPYEEKGRLITWDEFGTLAEAVELTWGGRWKKPDRPHVEWTGGLTLGQLRAGKRPESD